jgi:hypothetical protein
MAKKIKHSKVKNTGVLFELLVRQITSDTMGGMDNSPALKIVKEYFGKNTALKKELNLYSTLLKEKFNNKNKCEKFVDAVLVERAKLNNPTIKRQKYNLIKEIRGNYELDDFFRTKISNYKINASIYKLFEAHTNKGINNPKDIFICKDTIIEHVSNSVIKTTGEKIINEYAKQDKSLRLIGYKILIEKFNNKYGRKLNLEQKELLRNYINNVSNNGKLMEHLRKEATISKRKITNFANKIDDKITSIKLLEVANQLKRIEKTKNISEKYLTTMMNVYELLEECNSVNK